MNNRKVNGIYANITGGSLFQYLFLVVSEIYGYFQKIIFYEIIQELVEFIRILN